MIILFVFKKRLHLRGNFRNASSLNSTSFISGFRYLGIYSPLSQKTLSPKVPGPESTGTECEPDIVWLDIPIILLETATK